MRPFSLVIFDDDGVLVNSETLYRELLAGLFPELGAVVSPDELRRFTGISATTMWSAIREKNRLTLSLQELVELEKERKFRKLQETDLQATPGVYNFIQAIRAKGIKTAIASSGMRKNIGLILDKTGLNGLFDHIVSGDMVRRGKPHPDIFMQAAEPFDVSPEKCAVVEDSTNGLLAAAAAGMFGIAYRNPGSGNQDLRTARLIIDRFDAPELVQLFG